MESGLIYVQSRQHRSMENTHMISKGTTPTTVIILFNNYGRDHLIALTGQITEDDMYTAYAKYVDTSDAISWADYSDAVKFALVGGERFNFDVDRDRVENVLSLDMMNESDIWKTLIEIKLKTMAVSEAVEYLALASHSSITDSAKTEKESTAIHMLSKEKDELDSGVTNLLSRQKRWEKKSYQILSQIICDNKRKSEELNSKSNAKKRRIRDVSTDTNADTYLGEVSNEEDGRDHSSSSEPGTDNAPLEEKEVKFNMQMLFDKWYKE